MVIRWEMPGFYNSGRASNHMCISGHKISNKTLTVVTEVGGRCSEGVKNSIGYLSLSIIIFGIFRV